MASRGKHVPRAPLAKGASSSRKVASKRGPERRTTAPSQRVAAKGHRTLVHLAVPQDVVDDLDTLLWLRVTAAGASVEAIRGGKNQIYDEAVEEFLTRHERRPCEALTMRQPTRGWRTLWVSTPLVERCTQVATRESVSVGRVVGQALSSFLGERITPSWRAFRQEASDRARALLTGKSKR